MVFSSLIFLFVFFPLCLLIYFITPTIKAKNYILLAFSLIFYAWGEPKLIVLMAFTSFVCYFFALVIEHYKGSAKAKYALIATLVITLSSLALFKYSSFFLQNVNVLFKSNMPTETFTLPLGISFYTFQALTYVIDVYRSETKAQRSFPNLLLYVSMFPQLVAGPIVRYSDIDKQIMDRKTTISGFSDGITRFLIGLGKKVLLANTLGTISRSLLDGNLTGLSVAESWVGIICFTLQIYFDFSGYSDMAIGLGKMFGFTYLENFNFPYISRSVSEFWKRWHMSLSSFFRDYVYIPLGGNRKHQILNLFIVWSLTGLWHGANWNFILWGIYYFILITIEKKFLGRFLEKLPSFIGWFYSIIAIMVGWVFFYFTDLSKSMNLLKIMFFASKNALFSDNAGQIISNNAIVICVAIIACYPIFNRLEKLYGMISISNKAPQYAAFGLILSFNIILLIICTASLVGSSYNPFLYFRF